MTAGGRGDTAAPGPGPRRPLPALADRWTTTPVQRTEALSPFEGAEDLDAGVALQRDLVLFMEGAGSPPS